MVDQLARKIAGLFERLPQVSAIALGGSSASGKTDALSDIDLYIYTHDSIPLADRQGIMKASGGASQASLGLNFWGPGDEWFDAASGREIDLVYFDVAWMEAQLRQVLDEHQPSLGYTTCLWRTVRFSKIYYDPHGWFDRLQNRCQAEYPEALRRNIIALNHPVLRTVIPSYAHQVEKALQRRDYISLNHRLAALFASYFDVLFALNRVLHPGEKRMVEFALAHCAYLPLDMAVDIELVLRASAKPGEQLMIHLNRLLDRLDHLLRNQRLLAG